MFDWFKGKPKEEVIESKKEEVIESKKERVHLIRIDVNEIDSVYLYECVKNVMSWYSPKDKWISLHNTIVELHIPESHLNDLEIFPAWFKQWLLENRL